MCVGEMIRALGLVGFGLASTAAALLCIAFSPQAALTGWLAAAVVFQAVPLGALVLLAMMRLIHGQWESDLRCDCEAAAGLWALALPAFFPVLIGVEAIYEWPDSPLEGAFQDAWLSVLPFVLRTLLWFAVLAVIARSQVGGRASPRASALALIVMTLGASVLAVDWLMSIDTSFHSAGFGLTVFALEICVAYPVVLLLRLVHPPVPERPAVLGSLLLVLLLLWLFFQFTPYLVAWSSNSPDQAKWYAVRASGVWTWVLGAIAALGIMPLLALLLPRVRRSPRAIGLAAISVLAGKILEFGWLALPGRGPIAALAYLFALCGLGAFAASYLMPGWTWWPPVRKSAT